MTIEQLPAAARIATETALKEAGRRRWLGKSINRVEDPRFLRGEGRYIDDISLPGMAHAEIVGNSAFAFLGAERVVNNGTMVVDFELNKKQFKVFPAGGPPKPDRTAGDLLISL